MAQRPSGDVAHRGPRRAGAGRSDANRPRASCRRYGGCRRAQCECASRRGIEASAERRAGDRDVPRAARIGLQRPLDCERLSRPACAIRQRKPSLPLLDRRRERTDNEFTVTGHPNDDDLRPALGVTASGKSG